LEQIHLENWRDQVKFIYPMLLALALVFPACNRTDNDRVRAASPNPEQLKQERDDYVKAMNAKLTEFDDKLDGLDARAKAMTGTSRDAFKKQIDALHDQRDAVSRKLDDLGKVSADSWMSLKPEVDNAMANLERSYAQVSATNEPVPSTAPKTQRK
jgi:small-conductance mechanosensitive channel